MNGPRSLSSEQDRRMEKKAQILEVIVLEEASHDSSWVGEVWGSWGLG